MDSEILDTRKAFQPGSGYFGWGLIPDVKIVGEFDMNHRMKVIDAINHFETQQKDVATQEQRLEAARTSAKAAEQELTRTLRAVYGGRAAKGVVLRGTRYSLAPVGGSDDFVLVVGEADFEVLG